MKQNRKQKNFAFAGAGMLMMSAGLVLHPATAGAVPASTPKIVVVPGAAGEQCRKISTAGVDHGKAVAQKYADDLLKGDLAAFKKRHKLSAVKVRRRFRVCKYHLWFFGNEYNCTSGVVICWPTKNK